MKLRGQTLPLVVLVLVAFAAVFFVAETQNNMRGHGHGTHGPFSGLAAGGSKTISVVAYTDGSCIATPDCDQPGAGVTPPASSFASVLGPAPIACVAPTCPAPPCHDSVFMSPLAHCCTPKQRPCRNFGECAAEHASLSLGSNPFACSVYFPPFAPTSFIGTLGGLFHPADSGGFGCCTFCGDGVRDNEGLDDVASTADDEECDDNNQVSGDGCSSTCKTEVPIGVVSGPSISIVKTPVFNFTRHRKIVVWGILLNVTSNGSNATNVTLNDTLINSTFINSSPSSVNGTNISLGNLTNGTLFVVNVTAEVNCTMNLTNTTVFWLYEEEDFVSTGDNVGLGWFTQDDDFLANTTSVSVNTSCFVAGKKDDFPDPLNLSNSTVLNYTITVNVSGDFNFTNVTVNDVYPPQTESFISSEPAPDAGTNNTWSLGNLTNGTVFLINISVNISQQANGTVINNTANITWNDTEGIVYIFPVRENTTLLAPVDTNLTVTKTAASTVIRNGLLTYTITISVNNEDAFNVTANDSLPGNVTFISAVPANVSNLTWTVGNISAGASSVILLTVQVNETTQIGTVLNNTVNITFNNITGGLRSASAVAQTTVVSNAGQGGGSPGIGRWVPYEEVPMPQYPQITQEEQMTFDSMLDAPRPAWPLLDANIQTDSVACGYVSRGGEVIIKGSEDTVPVPPGFEVIAEPLEFSCAGDSLDFTLSVPDNFEEVRVLRCKGGSCAEMPREVFTDELVCANKTLQVIRRDEVLSRAKGLEKPQAFASKAKQLSSNDRSIVGGSIRLTLTGELQSEVNVEVSRAESVPKPLNPTLSLLGTPHQVIVSGGPAVLPASVAWSFIVPDGYDVTNFAVYAIKGDEWVYLGAQYNAASKLVTVQVPNLNDVTVGGKVTFVMVGLADPGSWVESEPRLAQNYDGNGARDAIILVHGFGAAATWQPFVDDFQLTSQPYQVWLFSYPASKPNEDNAKALASFLELHASEYDNVYIVAHSLGTMVAREALESARTQGLPVLGKVKKVVLIAGPGAGTPTVEVFKELFTKFLAEKTALGVLNMHPSVYDELSSGIGLEPLQGIEYDVVAGNVGYWFTEGLFGGQNDGVVAVRSAQQVGSRQLNNQCDDYFELSVSHVDLNDHPAGRRVAERLVTGGLAAANPDLALPGFNQFVRLQVDDCSAEDRVFVLGRRVSELAAADPSGCACGNGVCGLGESQESCPGDCVREVVRSTGCIMLPIPMMLLVFVLLIVTGVALVRKHVQKKLVAKWVWVVIAVLVGASVLMQAYHASSCLPKFPAVYLALISVLVLLGIDYLVSMMPPRVPKRHDINREIGEIESAIEKIKK